MRDPNRIHKILDKISEIWIETPDARFFQLMDYIKSTCELPDDSFYVDDDDFYKKLKENYNK